MFKRNKIYSAVVAATLLSASLTTLAQESATGTASVTVANAISFSGTPLNFGRLSVVQNLDVDGVGGNVDIAQSDIPQYVIDSDVNIAPSTNSGVSADNSTNDQISQIAIIEAGSPAVYTISDAAPFTALRVQLGGAEEDGAGTSLTDAKGVAAAAVFNLTPVGVVDTSLSAAFQGAITFQNTTITVGQGTSGGNTGANLPINNSSNQLRTNAAGAAEFALGATLTPAANALGFPAATYTGTFTVLVQY